MLAGFVQGISGFALGLVAMVFWSGEMPPQMAAPLIAICSVAGQLTTLGAVRASFEPRRAVPIVLAGVAGLPAGIAVLPLIDAAEFRVWVGVLLCAYCPAMLLLPSLPALRWGGGWADAAAGAIGGIMGGIAGLSGPAPTLWLTLRGWEREVQRGVIQAYLIVVQLAALAGFAAGGFLTAPVLRLAAWTVPCALLPSVLGAMLYGRLGGDGFRRLVLALLALTGVALLMSGH